MKGTHLLVRTGILLCTAFYITSCRELAPENEVATAHESAESRIEPETAYPGEQGVLKNGKLFGKEISYTEIDGQAIFEGDIVLTREQLGETSGARTQGLIETLSLWPNNTIPYEIDASVSNKEVVLAAIAEIEATTTIRFSGGPQRASVPNYDFIRRPNFVTFRPGRGYSSSIGMIGGEQFITLPIGATKGALLHEIGHTIGLMHEHTRADRDGFVKVNLNNVAEAAKPNLTKLTSDEYNELHYGKFDFGSIMMMDSYAYSNNKLPMMTTLDGKTFTVQREHLSENDIKSITAAYADLFAVIGGKIYAGDATKGKTTEFAGYFPATEKMFAVPSRLFATRDIGMWKIKSTGGTGIGVGGNFPTKGMTYYNDYMYVLQNGYIRKIGVHNPANYNIGYQYWLAGTAITFAKGFLFIVNGEFLFRVSTGGTEYVTLGAGYKGITEMVALKDKVYFIKGGKIYKLDPMTGVASLHGQVTLSSGAQLTSNGKKLLFTDGYTLNSMDENGVSKLISYGWQGVTELAAIDQGNQ
jgi:hypothetical protein